MCKYNFGPDKEYSNKASLQLHYTLKLCKFLEPNIFNKKSYFYYSLGLLIGDLPKCKAPLLPSWSMPISYYAHSAY